MFQQLRALWEKLVHLGSSTASSLVHPKGFKVPITLLENIEIEQFWSNPDPFAGDLIDFLKEEGYIMGILTDSILIEQKIKQVLDIASKMNAVVSSRDAGATKPDPVMYRKIMKKVGIDDPAFCLFVGHDDDELVGSREFGFHTVNLLDHGDSLLKLKEFLKVYFKVGK